MKNIWVPEVRTNPQAQFRLFCFPYAGGGSSAFAGWPRRLPATVEVVSVHLPGRDDRFREPAFRSLDPLLATLVEVLSPYLDHPFAFFGHSLGAWIAFYLARRLRRDGLRQPAHVFVAGCRAPQVLSRHPAIHKLPRAAFLQELQGRYGPFPREILNDSELLQLFIEVLQADFALLETIEYSHEAPLDCGISAYGGAADPIVSETEIHAWHAQTRDRFASEIFPGDHFFVKSNAPAVLNKLSSEIGPYLNREIPIHHARRF